MLASESAALLAGSGKDVVAVDLDLYRGDLHYRLDVRLEKETYTVLDLLPLVDELDERILDNALAGSPSGARMLPAPVGQTGLNRVEEPHVTKILEALSGRFEHVIVDTHGVPDGVTRAAFAVADSITLFVIPEIACIGSARSVIQSLRCSGTATPVVIVNRSLGESDLLTIGDIESSLGLSVSLCLPEETAGCRRLGDQGLRLAGGGTPLGNRIAAMARMLFFITPGC